MYLEIVTQLPGLIKRTDRQRNFTRTWIIISLPPCHHISGEFYPSWLAIQVVQQGAVAE